MSHSFKFLFAMVGFTLCLSGCRFLPEVAPTAFRTIFEGVSIQSVKARDKGGTYFIEDESLAKALEVFLENNKIDKNKVVTAKLSYIEFVIPEPSRADFVFWRNTRLILNGISGNNGAIESVSIRIPDGSGKVKRLVPGNNADDTYDVTKVIRSRNLSCYATYTTSSATPATPIHVKYRFELSFTS